MKILIVGTGYVGLVTAACLSEMGHHVMCLDINEEKIARLKGGEIPIYEPGLQELVERNAKGGRLLFTTDYEQGVKMASVCFIAVPTPSLEDGSCDLSYVLSAAKTIALHMDAPQIIVNKSTSPIGTTEQVRKLVDATLKERGLTLSFDVVSNPEFLKEGCAVNDCMKPDRIILGLNSPRAEKVMKEIYSSFTINHDRILIMDPLSAEMTKYAANAMLALRISFMNELANLCEEMGANIKNVRVGIGSDQRIGYQFLYAGAGYGGSCFPKDIRALSSMAKQHEVQTPILDAIETTNERQKRRLVEKLVRVFSGQEEGIKNKKIAIWGLSFKPDTDDIREAPSLVLIQALLEQGAWVRAYDPVAMPNTKKYLEPHPRLQFCSDEYEASLEADAIVLVTEWKQFRFVDFSRILTQLKQPIFIDGRNQYEPIEMRSLGFTYLGMGIPSSLETALSTLQTTLYTKETHANRSLLH